MFGVCDTKGSRLEKEKIYLFLRLFYLIKSSPCCLLAARDVPQVAFRFGAQVPYGGVTPPQKKRTVAKMGGYIYGMVCP